VPTKWTASCRHWTSAMEHAHADQWLLARKLSRCRIAE
jgi:hypothetical protein